MFYVYHNSQFVEAFQTLAEASRVKDKIADPGKVKIVFNK